MRAKDVDIDNKDKGKTWWDHTFKRFFGGK